MTSSQDGAKQSFLALRALHFYFYFFSKIQNVKPISVEYFNNWLHVILSLIRNTKIAVNIMKR